MTGVAIMFVRAVGSAANTRRRLNVVDPRRSKWLAEGRCCVPSVSCSSLPPLNALARPWRHETIPRTWQRTAGFTTAPRTDRSATLMCLVNPTNPTGDYWNVDEMKAYLEGACDAGTTVIVGERDNQCGGGGRRSAGHGCKQGPPSSLAFGELLLVRVCHGRFPAMVVLFSCNGCLVVHIPLSEPKEKRARSLSCSSSPRC